MSDAGRRFLVAPGQLRPGRIELGADATHHMRVMRLRPGARVVIFDGHGRQSDAEVKEFTADAAIVLAGAVEYAARVAALRLRLVQALPVKLPRFDTVVRMCTELGVERISPVTSERGQLPGGGATALARRCARWARIAATAAQQCGSTVVPRIDAPRPLRELEWQQLPMPILVLDPDAAVPLARLDRDHSPGEATIVVGPEGGLSAHERRQVLDAGGIAVSLGPRTLRADTAGSVALAVLQARWGDLGGAPAG